MATTRLALLVGFSLLVLTCPAQEQNDWVAGRDDRLGVSFRYPENWKASSPQFDGRTEFKGPDGSLQLSATTGDTAEAVCWANANHHLQPYGSHPTIRTMRVQGQKACLIWPSDDSLDSKVNPHAELVVQFPKAVVIDGSSYAYLTLWADKNHILDLIRTLRFETPGRQNAAGGDQNSSTAR